MKDYPVIPITASFISGIILASQFTISNDVLSALIALLAGALLIIILLNRNNRTAHYKKYLLVIICFIVLFLSIINYQSLAKIVPLNIHKEKGVSITGRINSIELINERSLTIHIDCDTMLFSDSILVKNVQLIGRVFENNKSKLDSLYSHLYPGYFLKTKGTFSSGREKRNPGEFDYREYLLRKNISGSITIISAEDVEVIAGERELISSFIFDIRKTIDNVISKYHNKETAGLLRGLLLADRSDISSEAKTDFINSGVVHILAVSGLHVGYIVMIFLIVSGRFNITLRLILTMIGIFFFLLITNSPPSVFRASVMAMVVLITRLTGRNSNIFNSLALAALIILLIDAKELFNPGFQLSFSAVLAIALFVPTLNKIIHSSFIKNGWIKNLLLFLIVSLSAQLGTLPFTLMYFGKFSVVGIFTNLFVIPLAGIIIAIGILTITLSILSGLLASFASATNMLLSGILFDVIHFTGNLEFSFLSVQGFTTLDTLIFYVMIIVFIYFYKIFLNPIPKTLLIILGIVNIYLFTSLDNEPFFKKNELNILMIDVGQGDAILIKFPNGETALIDAGDATFYSDTGERIILPLLSYLGIDKIDYGFVSHLDSDHYGGFVSLIHHNKIKKIIKPETDTASLKDKKFESYLVKSAVPFESYKTEKMEIGNTSIYVLTGDLITKTKLSHNNKSGVLKLVYGESEILFTGDIEKQAEQIYASSYQNFLQSDILKVAHHGSKTSSTQNFLAMVNPDISLISAGIQNKFKHPSIEIVNRIKQQGSKIHRTDESGALFLVTDGSKFSLVEWNSK